MQRIVSQAKQIKPKHAALFLLVAAAVAAIVYLTGREAQVEQRIEAGATVTQERPTEPPQQDDEEASESTAEPLTLTLTASRRICETGDGQGYFGGRSYQDDEGNWQIETWSTGWFGVAETPITWSVAGGTAPYTLVIDGETRDAEQSYAGPSGTASVSCAMSPGETFVEDEEGRGYHAQPAVDSGLKTIRATVTDGTGATASASAQVYVILIVGGSADIMQSGKTYRLFGTLLTVPATIDDLVIGGMVESDGGGPTSVGLGLSAGGAEGWILVEVRGLREVARSTRSATAGDGDPAVGASETALDAQIDELVESFGRRPQFQRK